MEITLTAEILGYISAIILGIIAYRLSKSSDKKIDLAVGLTVTVLCFFITSYCMIRFVQLKKLTDNQEFIENLKTDNEALRIAEDLTNTKKMIAEDNNTFFNAILSERKSDFKEFLDNLSNEELIYNQSDFLQFEKDVIKIFTKIDNNQIILATSRVDYNQWWKKESFGIEYTRANEECIKSKNAIIKRIFIFDDESEKQKNIEILREQQEIGIEIYYVFNDEIREIIKKKRDIIVVGDKFAGELILNERDMSQVKFYLDKKKINQTKQDWQELYSKSKKF